MMRTAAKARLALAKASRIRTTARRRRRLPPSCRDRWRLSGPAEAALAAIPRAGETEHATLAAARANLEAAGQSMDDALGRNGAAKCAVDIALHDLAARRLGVSLVDLLGNPRPTSRLTDFSIGIDEPAVVAGRARVAAAAHPFARV